MTKKRVLLIDADHILWKVVPAKKQTQEEILQYGDQTLRTFEDICKELDKYFIEKMLVPTHADFYIGYLGGDGNFRKSVCEDYKFNRSEDRPKFFYDAKRYLVSHWGFVLSKDMEAEDCVGISMDLIDPELYEYIIAGQDHDLDQLEGLHYNPVRESWREISQIEADYIFYTQMITGCSTDKVQGIPGLGAVGAKKILGECPGTYESPDEINYSENPNISFSLLNRVMAAYIEKYGLYDGIYYFQMNFRLLRILRESKDFILPKFYPTVIEKTKEEEV